MPHEQTIPHSPKDDVDKQIQITCRASLIVVHSFSYHSAQNLTTTGYKAITKSFTKFFILLCLRHKKTKINTSTISYGFHGLP